MFFALQKVPSRGSVVDAQRIRVHQDEQMRVLAVRKDFQQEIQPRRRTPVVFASRIQLVWHLVVSKPVKPNRPTLHAYSFAHGSGRRWLRHEAG